MAVHQPIDHSEDRRRVKTAVLCAVGLGLVIGVVGSTLADVPSDDRTIWIGGMLGLALAGVAYITTSTRSAARGIIEADRDAMRAIVAEPIQQLAADLGRLAAFQEHIAQQLAADLGRIAAFQEQIAGRIGLALDEQHAKGRIETLVERTPLRSVTN